MPKINSYDAMTALSGTILFVTELPGGGHTQSISAEKVAAYVLGRLTVDAAPTAGSKNPVQSGGVYAAIAEDEDIGMLRAEEIENTVQSIQFAADGQVERVLHRRGAVLIREDIFDFTDEKIVETRTLATGAELTLTTDLETLETTVAYTAA